MNFLSIVLVAAKRLWNNKGLMLCSIVGLIVAVGLISSIPLYADAANFRVLKEQLTTGENVRARPPFAFMYRYIGAWHGPVDWDDFGPVNEYMTESVPGIVGLPLEASTRYVKTDNFSLFPAADVAYIGLRQPLGWVNLAVIDNVEAHVNLLEGRFPQPALADAEVIDVLVSRDFADDTGVQVGEAYVAFKRAETAIGVTKSAKEEEEAKPTQFQVRIAGIWAATDPDETFWFYNPSSLSNSCAQTTCQVWWGASITRARV